MRESTLNESEEFSTDKDGVLTFIITIPKAEFTSMIIVKNYRRKEKGRFDSTRQYTILQSGI